MCLIACLTVCQFFLIGIYSLDVRLPPTITTSPIELKIFRSEDEIVLECEAIGNPKPQYEWLKNGNILTIPSPNGNLYQIKEGTIAIRPLTTLDEGYYQCTAFNQYGKALSKMTYLRRAVLSPYSPNIPIFNSTLIEEGQPYSLRCNPTKCFPKPTYSWAVAKTMVDDTQFPVVLGRRIQVDEQGNLHFSYVLPEDAQDGKLYKCNMYNPHLDLTMGGSYSRLNVRSKGGVWPFVPVQEFSSQTPVIALEGRNVSLRCFFAGSPEPTISWRRRGDGQLPIGRHDIVNHNTELIIRRVEPSDEGEYQCEGSNSKGQSAYAMHIDVQAVPEFRFIANRPHNLNATEGTTVTIFCQAYADPQATVVWLRNGERIDLHRFSKYHINNRENKLTISNVCKNCEDGSSDLAVIQCNASNVHGYAFSDGYLNILRKTEIIMRPKDIIVKKEDLTVLFECSAISDDSTPVYIDWYRVSTTENVRDELLRNSSNKSSKIIISWDSSLLTLNVENSSDWIQFRGLYKCQARNGFSMDVAEVRLDADDFLPPPAFASTAGIGDLWWIFIIIAAILLLLILLICCCICLQRNKGDSYPVDEKERKSGNNPEKELADGGFHDYQRPEGEPLKGSRASLSSSIKMDSDEEASLNEYGDLDPGKFTEDGSFIGDYGVDRRRGKAGDHKV